ncbi:hypothetical protein SKAU_G00354820 [Synaphobranchus kaupii]|uniref:Uncharacterized protein n=1 Tax=Synaphobranchus kaupii TaxID=118154 RepID=A0A9Q1EH37_SYNKA|nr:hypothetical protein SKAU_G00354820 [Synaphobranchus kaupii]
MTHCFGTQAGDQFLCPSVPPMALTRGSRCEDRRFWAPAVRRPGLASSQIFSNRYPACSLEAFASGSRGEFGRGEIERILLEAQLESERSSRTNSPPQQVTPRSTGSPPASESSSTDITIQSEEGERRIIRRVGARAGPVDLKIYPPRILYSSTGSRQAFSES